MTMSTMLAATKAIRCMPIADSLDLAKQDQLGLVGPSYPAGKGLDQVQPIRGEIQSRPHPARRPRRPAARLNRIHRDSGAH
jgi:hypothetical protein